MRNFFGANDFGRFDAFVKSRIAPDVKVVKSADGKILFGGSGGSGISLDQAAQQLRGTSYTVFLTFARNQSATCSVSATMSGAKVSASDTSSNGCGENVFVNLVSTSYLPNSQYCINGTHVAFGNTLPPSSDCLTSPAEASKIVYVTFEQTATDDLPIDTNPNAGGGLRIFPDKKNPTEQVNRRKIRVRAKIGANTPGIRIYFKNFDPDDPSADSAPIDVETTIKCRRR